MGNFLNIVNKFAYSRNNALLCNKIQGLCENLSKIKYPL